MVEISPGRSARVGALAVRRVLPQRRRRTVGAWCFADHLGPVTLGAGGAPGAAGAGIGPHPHCGLQAVTWLVEGELLHVDSLGSEQLIRPGQLNLMTAGHGVAHAEEDPRRAGALHGVQLWVAQPEQTRHGPPAFEHHAGLPRVSFGTAEATVLVGSFAGLDSPARRDTDHVGVELVLHRGLTVVPLRPAHEHGLIVLEGDVALGANRVAPGVLAYLGPGRDECAVEAPEDARVVLLGGLPFPEAVLMWWNFVARGRDEISEARRQWADADPRFGRVASSLARIEVGRPPWE